MADEAPTHEHQWQDTGFADLDDCGVPGCEATRAHAQELAREAVSPEAYAKLAEKVDLDTEEQVCEDCGAANPTRYQVTTADRRVIVEEGLRCMDCHIKQGMIAFGLNPDD